MFVCDFINLKADSISFGQILSGCIRCKKRQELISLMGQIFKAFRHLSISNV